MINNDSLSYIGIAISIVGCAIFKVPTDAIIAVAGFGFGSIVLPKILKILVE